jgi:thioredoxin reductase (NADPH)
LAAAVYGASEGLDVLVLDSHAPGGQAGSSSRIENYLGFPTCISGQELASRAYVQAQKFGAEIMIAKTATQLTCHGQRYAVRIDDGPSVPARTVIVATGAEYRQPALAKLAQFEGAGVYHGATFVESQLCRPRRSDRRRGWKCRRPGRCLPRADRQSGPYAHPLGGSGGNDVAPLDSTD